MGLRDTISRFLSGGNRSAGGISPASSSVPNPMSLADSNAQNGKVVPEAWANTVFGPGLPITPWQGTQKEPRDFDYLMAANATLVPRVSYDLIAFTELRQIYKTIPEVRLAIHSLIREVSVYKPTLTDADGDEINEPDLRWLIESPDRRQPWNVWLVKFLKNVLIYDAASVYIERGPYGYHKYSKLVRDAYETWKGEYGEVAADNPDARAAYDRYLKGSVDHAFEGGYGIGAPSALRIINGATLFVLIDEDGNTPEPPAPAYTQIVQGTPFLFLSSRELWYRPMFPDLESPYGTTGIEECLPWITIIANMLGYRIAHYREGTMPEAFYTAPESWSSDQVIDWQIKRATRLAGSMAERSREQYMPYGFASLVTKQVDWTKEEYEQARDNVLFTFGLLPSELGITKGQGLGGKGYLSEMDKTSHQLGPGPLIKFVEGFFEFVLNEMGRDDLSFAMKSPSSEGDPAKNREESVKLFHAGMLTVNQALEALDKEPLDKNGELGGNKRFLIQGNNLWEFDDLLAGIDTQPVPPLNKPATPDGAAPAVGAANPPPAAPPLAAPAVAATVNGNGNGHVDPLANYHKEEPPHVDPLEEYHKVYVPADQATWKPTPGAVGYWVYGKEDSLKGLGLQPPELTGCEPASDRFYRAPILPVATAFPWQGQNVSVQAVLDTDGGVTITGVFKPASGEDPDQVAAIGGPLYLRAEAAWRLDRALGFYLVPTCWVTKLDGETGSVQIYVRTADPPKLVTDYAPEWIEKVAVLDYIMGQMDRGDHNWLTHPGDPTRPVLHDNGMAFPVGEEHLLNSAFLDMREGRAIGADVDMLAGNRVVPYGDATIQALNTLMTKKLFWASLADLVGVDVAQGAKDRARRMLLGYENGGE